MKAEDFINILKERVPYLKDYDVDVKDDDELVTIEFTHHKSFEDVDAYLGNKDEDSGYVKLEKLSLESRVVFNFFNPEDEDMNLMFAVQNSVPEFKKSDSGMSMGSLQKQMKLEEIMEKKFSYEGTISGMGEEELKNSNKFSYVIKNINKVLYELDEFAEFNLEVKFP